MKGEPKNVAASVHARLLAGAHLRNETFTLTLQRYAAERFLYRLGASPYREHFILKGAMLFALWGGSLYRATRDVDLTGYAENDSANLVAIMKELCSIACPEDGLVFLPASVTAEPIRDKSEHHGFRVKLRAMLDTARIPLQIGVGFGDVVEPPATEASYPTLLDAPAPRIRAYQPEAVIAEKFHAMVTHGELNSRYKDFYDLYVLANRFTFDGPQLAGAIAATFERRRTAITSVQSTTLSAGFYSNDARATQWRTYLDRNGLPGAPVDFVAVGSTLTGFLGPVWIALAAEQEFTPHWESGGPWRVRS
ncbi:MAG: nucleotidyl transferase AbiEii/AbiGii toxin family protein [Betaproteobacteria bacterium]